jgi:hypothetical protein
MLRRTVGEWLQALKSAENDEGEASSDEDAIQNTISPIITTTLSGRVITSPVGKKFIGSSQVHFTSLKDS